MALVTETDRRPLYSLLYSYENHSETFKGIVLGDMLESLKIRLITLSFLYFPVRLTQLSIKTRNS